MTRRERLQAKIERRTEWAAKAETRSQAKFDSVRQLADAIPLGQPILVGHHSERHMRRDIAKIDSGMRKAVEEHRLAAHHESKASGLESQLERSTFSDDPDAIEQLEAKIAKLEAERDQMKRINAAWRKKDAGSLEAMGLSLERITVQMAKLPSYEKSPYPGYAMTNRGSEIRRLKSRIEDIKRRQEKSRQAEEAGGVIIIDHGNEYCSVTFAEKPEREVLDSLREAGYRWASGSWVGKLAALPRGLR